MDDNKKNSNARRQFFSKLFQPKPAEKVKLLTADGQLVEVEKDLYNMVKGKKVTNQEIYDWMKNPSKEQE